MKEGKYTKALAKIQVGAIFPAREIFENFFTYIYRYFYHTFVWRRNVGTHPDGHLIITWRPETNRNMCHGVVLLKGEFIS